MFYNTNFLWDMNKNLAKNCNEKTAKKRVIRIETNEDDEDVAKKEYHDFSF